LRWLLGRVDRFLSIFMVKLTSLSLPPGHPLASRRQFLSIQSRIFFAIRQLTILGRIPLFYREFVSPDKGRLQF
jgi:hypothetical protein